MTAYWVARVRVTDPDRYAKYIDLSGPATQKYGGRIIARGGAQAHLEGAEYERTVIIEFDSVEQGEAAYNSPEYQEALQYANGASERSIVVVEGAD